MLKALELHGFKSFADKTRFEFPPGITVVVGPNGSGKSNIVDCLKWVLGEQSAKSLRGKEMADVIFKGSGTSGRKPMNTAEATLIFENADGKLPIDAPEVHVTRRVYRSGEGEYLINRQPARLKDIRDLFRGTGVGIDAYSLIEQGKVDKLLQASAKDRRAIFEEAAGISRFKAKKVEAQRRLERVDQNLLRLSDIVEEVENRLKTVRSQASKARRYRELSERLQQLRTQIARVDWRRMSEQLATIEADLTSAIDQVQAADAESQRLEAQQLELEAAALAAAETMRNGESQLASVRQQIAQCQGTSDHERSRSIELEEEALLHGRNLLAMSDKAGNVRLRLKTTQGEVAAAATAQQAAALALAGREEQLADLIRTHDAARTAADERRQQYVVRLQAAASLASQVEAGETQLAAVQRSVLELQRQLAALAADETRLAGHREALRAKESALAEQIAAHAVEVEKVQQELEENRNLHASRADDLAQLHSRQRGIVERTEVLEEFERTLEGLGSGVKQVLARAKVGRQEAVVDAPQPDAHSKIPISESPWSLVRGVVADFVQVGVEHAAAIDVALGEAAQAVIVTGSAAQAQELIAAASDLAGRVVAWPTAIESDRLLPAVELTPDMVASVRVIARADKLVDCPAAFRPLLAQLLARTFVVHALEDALRLHQAAPLGTRLVTLGGELLDEYGAIHFGPRQSATSLVSRRSQLRAARLDLGVLAQLIGDAQRETVHLKREIERHEATLRQLHLTGKALDQQAAEARVGLQSLAAQAEQSARQRAAAQGSLAETAGRCQAIESSLQRVTQELAEAQATAAASQAAIASHEQQLTALDVQRQQLASLVTAAKVELARCEQRSESLRLRLSQFEDDCRERERAVSQVREQLRQANRRYEAAQLAMLAASATIATAAIRQELLAANIRACTTQRAAALAERTTLAGTLNTVRRRAAKLREKQHELELNAEQVRHERRTLADRLREDYQIEVADLTSDPTAAEAQERAAVEEEIESLRRKINQIGAVNLDALDELDDLEQRFATLSGQHQDLTAAKQSLERIIQRINADSRRLFLETLESIRVNFQALYRKAFGGGKADIVLEEGVDVLECGVEIIATPPGKPSFNNSLLSGGERALTAVALLLAIFQFRPSPFCVLDEVDAPFDEANIGRFIDVLKEFLSWTRFVIVTHSKKTMTAATTLYGVTMQESGVSKRVSVRFDDVTEDGHIRHEALGRAGDGDAAESAA